MPERPNFALPEDVQKAWRPLRNSEPDRAEYWIDVAARRVRRRWPDVDARMALAAEDPRHLSEKDVMHLVVVLVVEVLGGPVVPRARSWSKTHGETVEAVTLESAGPFDGALWAPWMVELFEGSPSVPNVPVFSFPRPRALFREWEED